MDPTNTLDLVWRCIGGGEYDDAIVLLDAYDAWRRNGGFEPEGGDRTAAELRAACYDDDGEYLGTDSDGE